jgi:hypothetical protein
MGAYVGEAVNVGVCEGVKVIVGVSVGGGVGVDVRVFVGESVSVGVKVIVGVCVGGGVCVRVNVAVGVGEGMSIATTSPPIRTPMSSPRRKITGGATKRTQRRMGLILA